MKKFYYLIDKETNKFINFQYNGMSSDSISFYLVETMENGAGFTFEESVEQYKYLYEKEGKECIIYSLI